MRERIERGVVGAGSRVKLSILDLIEIWWFGEVGKNQHREIICVMLFGLGGGQQRGELCCGKYEVPTIR
jgi:hypothetical protein